MNHADFLRNAVNIEEFAHRQRSEAEKTLMEIIESSAEGDLALDGAKVALLAQIYRLMADIRFELTLTRAKQDLLLYSSLSNDKKAYEVTARNSTE